MNQCAKGYKYINKTSLHVIMDYWIMNLFYCNKIKGKQDYNEFDA